ncbi:MAG: DNA mismatch repair protein MutS, partial [Myxococcota bacterium]
EIRSRQGAVAELRERLDLRERLALVGEEVAPRLHAERLVAWGAAARPAPPAWERGIALFLAALTVATLAGWLLGAGPLPFGMALVLQSGFGWRRRARVRECIAGVEQAAPDLELLVELLACLEEESFSSPRLVALRNTVDSEGHPPSLQIRRLRRLRDLLDARRNQFFAPLGALLLFTTQVVMAVEAWRATCGPALEGWLDAVAELEALASLATQAYEHPSDPFPEILSDGPRFEAEGLGHPLLPESRCVRNDLALSRELQVLVVSGSNMSGKSTLLRSVGTNAVLALAGGTVRATRLALSPLAVGASIQVHDSLLEGASRFYAEITRLRAIVERTEGDLAVLFLLDEILHGTNSHDRRIGADAVVRSLLAAGALGLVTTHDLALAKVADALAPRAINVHFQDHLEDGRISFDYRMQPGVVTRSNALALMRAVGLEV